MLAWLGVGSALSFASAAMLAGAYKNAVACLTDERPLARAVLTAANNGGFVDGISGAAGGSVDGMPLEKQLEVRSGRGVQTAVATRGSKPHFDVRRSSVGSMTLRLTARRWCSTLLRSSSSCS